MRPTRPKLAILAQNNFDTAADFVFVSVFIVLNVHSFFNLFPYRGIRKMKHLYWIHTVIYRVFIYLKHHVYYVSINSFIYYVSKNNFLEQHVYNNMMFTSLILD